MSGLLKMNALYKIKPIVLKLKRNFQMPLNFSILFKIYDVKYVINIRYKKIIK